MFVTLFVILNLIFFYTCVFVSSLSFLLSLHSLLLLCYLLYIQCYFVIILKETVSSRLGSFQLNWIELISSLNSPSIYVPSPLPSTSNKVNFPPAKPQSFRRLAAFSRARKSDKTVSYRGEMEKKEMKKKRHRRQRRKERKRREMKSGIWSSSHICRVFDTRTRVSHLTQCVVADIMVSS